MKYVLDEFIEESLAKNNIGENSDDRTFRFFEVHKTKEDFRKSTLCKDFLVWAILNPLKTPQLY